MVISFQSVHENMRELLTVEKHFHGKPDEPTLSVLACLCTPSPGPHAHD